MGGKIINPTEKSKCKVFPVDISNVKVSGFLGKRMEVNRKVSIPSLYRNFEKHGTVDNFRIASGTEKGEITRRLATDSDLYKWMEGVSWDLQNYYNEKNDKFLDKLIKLVGKTQEKSGYINTFYTGEYKKYRFKNLESSHELYCGGHLIQAAIAHYRSTGKENFLNIAIKWADYICKKFGKGKIEENDGHPEVEMSLVELYRTTEKNKYLNLSEFFMEQEYKVLSNLKFLQFKEVLGHAVRMMYLASGATDYYSETGDDRYKKVLLKLWQSLAERKVYITGGIGSRYFGESFGEAYELPNLRAYAESCAAIAVMMWQFRMFLLFPESKYFDLFETTLYNGFLSGVSIDGKKYFYVNPLASTKGNHIRKEWYDCTCCPPNIQRMLSSLPGYFYSVNKKGIYINLYGESKSEITLPSGNEIKIIQKTDYPFDGKVKIDILCKKEEKFSIFLRIPVWSDKTEIKIGKEIYKPKSGYYEIKKKWKERNKIKINFDTSPPFYISHPEIESTNNCYAIKKGPVVYCLESIDNPGINLFSCKIRIQKLKEKFEDFSGIRIPSLYGKVLNPENKKLPLYEKEKNYPTSEYKRKNFKAIPYFLWANRGKSKMIVWIKF
ncbi:glycoside hydrolase family 127 protein [bacterium]|nr:glycoside hydrolase family 127 protein [bacterium]